MWKVKPTIISLLLLISFGNYLIVVKGNDDPPITPNDEFFTMAIDIFDINPDTYRLVVTGEVTNPLNLSLEEIKSMPVTTEIVRLTCVNYKFGRTSLTGVANWTGVRLSYILNQAKIDYSSVQDISFHTPHLGPRGYSTSLTVEEAFWDDVILAYQMNGEDLPTEHGFPLRLVCPRFYGYKWIKWVAYINVTATDYLGYWESVGFNDTPFVDISLPIYYSYVESDITLSNLKSYEPIRWLGIELILPIAATMAIIRFSNRWRRRLS